MTDLNPKVLEEKGAELQAQMVADLSGLDIRDCDLIGAINSIAHESNGLTGTLACVVLFHGTEEEWFEEREALLRNYEQNSIEQLKEFLRVDGLSLSIIRADMNVRLHDNLLGVKEISDKHKLDRTIVYVAQKTQPQLEAVGMSNVFHGQKFDWTFRPTKDSTEGEFTLALLAIPQPGLKPIEFTYRVGEQVPDIVSHTDNWPTSVFIDIPGHRKVFEVLNCDDDSVFIAHDLLQLFLTETGQLATVRDTTVVFYTKRYSWTSKVGYSEFDERLFLSPRFRNLLPKPPLASIYTDTVDEAICVYSDLLIATHDPKRELLFISTSMQGEEFTDVQAEIDRILLAETKHNIGLMFHTFVPDSVSREGLLKYIRETVNPELTNTVYVSPHFKYKETEGE